MATPRRDSTCLAQRRRRRKCGILAIGLLAGASFIARPARSDEGSAPNGETAAPSAGLFDQETLTGDWLGYRKRWEDSGLQLGGDEIAEILADPIGGQKQRTIFEGRFELFLNLDLEKALQWSGASFHANAYQIHGRGLSQNGVGNLLTVSNIEAQRATRLFDLWQQQELLDHAVSIRVGQLAADDEFYISQYAALFINSTFGWPAILGANLPSGGPAYPLATPGLRIKVAPSPTLAFTVAAFNGDPANPGTGNPQLRDASGTDFRVNSDRLVIGEVAYSSNLDPDSSGLPGTFKFGTWYHSGVFADQRFDTSGVSLASPASTGIPRPHRGDYGAYVIVDQMLWRQAETTDQGLAAFFRAAGNPPDRNLIEFHIDSGLTYKGLLPGRDGDTTGIGFSYARISAAQSALARDAATLASVHRPIPDFESVIEASYQAQLAPWWIVQPDVQVILHPGARLSTSSTATAKPIPDAFVVGLRTAIIF